MSNNRKTVGVLGGMGPEATVDFMSKVIAMTPAARDQDHVHMLVDHNPAVPDRQQALLEGGDDPGPVLAEMAKRLETAGADFLVIPCNTAYAFRAHVTGAVRIPLLSIIDVTVATCARHDAVGLLATAGCLRSEVYQDALAAAGIAIVSQTDDELSVLMQLIYRIKAGDRCDAVVHSMRDLAAALVARGAEAVIAGCTEIPLVLRDDLLAVPLVASTDVLARQTVALARGE
jgi:aspartate racemase